MQVQDRKYAGVDCLLGGAGEEVCGSNSWDPPDGSSESTPCFLADSGDNPALWTCEDYFVFNIYILFCEGYFRVST